MRQVDQPDRTIIHGLSIYHECAADLSSVPVNTVERRQVSDIPKPRVEVTDHQAEIKTCRYCVARVKATFLDNVKEPVQYGDNIGAWSVYLSIQQLIPEDRLQQLFADLYGM